ncbi:penicillin-binding protein 1A [Inhella inkyongensis]|uniref:Penicillin-binding protein 1A n=1 Tax=Inhella inkyongensis TaxID=392593 RepID=A0A840S711_9BURK|nr:PBP1A family penicillin-binding protein [Inhella inkyongensis]MBB5205298.1 penicillin-binding protein 1A [Inhella inkyongensis]
MLRRLLIWVLGPVLALTMMGTLAAAFVWQQLPSLDALADYQPKEPLRVLSADGALLGEFGSERRRFVPLAQIPKPLQNALLAVEDVDFWQHPGLDFSGMLRALWHNLWHERPQGASTITQQLARDMYLSKKQILSRKLVEMLLALKMERELGKAKILEVYMNQIYLGHRAYGFAAAAERYFGKPLAQLDTAEIALLAGLPQNPVHVNPVVNLPRTLKRQQHVLQRMVAVGLIDAAQAERARQQPLRLRPVNPLSGTADHALEMVRAELFARFGEEVYTRGLTAHTTLLAAEQRAAHAGLRRALWALERRQPYRGAEEGQADLDADGDIPDAAFSEHPDLDESRAGIVVAVSRDGLDLQLRDGRRIQLEGSALRPALPFIGAQVPLDRRIQRGARLRVQELGPGRWILVQRPQAEGAVVSLDPRDGSLRALVGGFDFQRLQFNHATQAYRQPGSSFKPLVYSALIEQGANGATQVSDQPIQIGDWQPRNHDGQYEESINLADALARSKNMVTIRLVQEMGPERVRAWSGLFGLEADRQPANLTLALGSGAATPFQMASAYGVFASGGQRHPTRLITEVRDAKGALVFQAQAQPPAQAISPRNAFVTAQLLHGVMARGTGAKASQALQRSDLYGKTGTTNDAVDAWFVGFQAERVASVWIGYPQPRSLGDRESGGGLALPVWVDVMRVALKATPLAPLQPPDDGLVAQDGTWLYEEFAGEAALKTIGQPPSAASAPASSAF